MKSLHNQPQPTRQPTVTNYKTANLLEIPPNQLAEVQAVLLAGLPKYLLQQEMERTGIVTL